MLTVASITHSPTSLAKSQFLGSSAGGSLAVCGTYVARPRASVAQSAGLGVIPPGKAGRRLGRASTEPGGAVPSIVKMLKCVELVDVS